LEVFQSSCVASSDAYHVDVPVRQLLASFQPVLVASMVARKRQKSAWVSEVLYEVILHWLLHQMLSESSL